MKKVLKYGTGQEVPEGAIYLSTLFEEVEIKIIDAVKQSPKIIRLVWHYFLVEVKE